MVLSRIAWCLYVLLGFSIVAGCGGEQPSVEPPTTTQLIDNFKRLLVEYQKQNNNSAPKSMDDLIELGASFDGGMYLLRTNKIVYYWGTSLADNSQSVLAYETIAPEAGGEVLLVDGTIKQMTAAEFAAAPKAGKKK